MKLLEISDVTVILTSVILYCLCLGCFFDIWIGDFENTRSGQFALLRMFTKEQRQISAILVLLVTMPAYIQGIRRLLALPDILVKSNSRAGVLDVLFLIIIFAVMQALGPFRIIRLVDNNDGKSKKNKFFLHQNYISVTIITMAYVLCIGFFIVVATCTRRMSRFPFVEEMWSICICIWAVEFTTVIALERFTLSVNGDKFSYWNMREKRVFYTEDIKTLSFSEDVDNKRARFEIELQDGMKIIFKQIGLDKGEEVKKYIENVMKENKKRENIG